MKKLLRMTALFAALTPAPAFADQDMNQFFDDLEKQIAAAEEKSDGQREFWVRSPLLFSYDLRQDVLPIFSKITREQGERLASLTYLVSAIYDLNGDGENEILFQDQDISGNPSSAYPTWVARYDLEKDEWVGAGKFETTFVVVPDVAADQFGYQPIIARGLVSDSRHWVTWDSETQSYRIDLEQFGDRIEMVEAEQLFTGEMKLDDILARDLGTDYLVMRSTRSGKDRVEIGQTDLNGDDIPEYFLSVRHQSVCKPQQGCPLLVYGDFSEGPFFRFYATGGDVIVSPEVPEGSLREIYFHRGDTPIRNVWSADAGRYKSYKAK